MATMQLYIGTGISSVTVHANNNNYPKTFYTNGWVNLTDLPDSGNAWINAYNDVTFSANYGNPISVSTTNPSGNWTLGNDQYISITHGRSITLTPTYTPSTSYTLTVNMPSIINSVTFTNGNTATYYNGSGQINYSSGVKISSVAMAGSGLSWSGTLYWSNGSSSYAFATVTNGSVSVYSSASQEQIDCTGNRTITIVAVDAPVYKVKIELGTGVSGGRYIKNSTTGTATTFSGDLTVDVGAGGYIYLQDIYYVTDYSYPVTASPSSGSAWTIIDASGTWSDHKVYAGSSAGTRTVTLTARYSGNYYYRVHYFHNDGSGDSGYKPSQNGYYQIANTSPNFNLSLLPTLTRAGYILKGWGYTSGATTYYTSTIPLTATSTNQNNPTVNNIYAIWEKKNIASFTWAGSDNTDATLFAAGKSISAALTATRWNNFLAKIAEVATAIGSSFSYTQVAAGGRITASGFNAARTGINGLTGHGTLPSAQSEKNNIKAALYNGTSSLKSALNSAINNYNNS